MTGQRADVDDDVANMVRYVWLMCHWLDTSVLTWQLTWLSSTSGWRVRRVVFWRWRALYLPAMELSNPRLSDLLNTVETSFWLKKDRNYEFRRWQWQLLSDYFEVFNFRLFFRHSPSLELGSDTKNGSEIIREKWLSIEEENLFFLDAEYNGMIPIYTSFIGVMICIPKR